MLVKARSTSAARRALCLLAPLVTASRRWKKYLGVARPMLAMFKFST